MNPYGHILEYVPRWSMKILFKPFHLIIDLIGSNSLESISHFDLLIKKIGHLRYALLKQSLSETIRKDRAALHRSGLLILKGHMVDNVIPPILQHDEKWMTSLTGKNHMNRL